MPIHNFDQFIQKLEEAGELIRISEPVHTELEITVLADREMKSPGGGYALLIEKPILLKGKISRFPLLINAFGSWKRMEIVLGRKLAELVEEIESLLKPEGPKSIFEGWKMIRKGIDFFKSQPRLVGLAPCQEEVVLLEDENPPMGLLDLPVLKCWPKDGGAYITLPQVFSVDPYTGKRNVGMYRIQIFDQKTAAMHWQVHKVGARHGQEYAKEGIQMPVAICLGGDPLMTFAATAPLPDGVDEVVFAGFLRKEGIPMVKCKTIELEVPAESDIVIEGVVDPLDLRPEGPFGDHTGFYTPIDLYPVFHAKAITFRKKAVFPATIVGKPPMEDYYLGTTSLKLFLPLLKMNFPEIVNIALPPEGVFHNLLFVSIKKQYPYQAYKVMHGLWGMGQMMFSKIIIVVDEDVDVDNTSEVLFHLCANVDPERDFLFTRGPCDSLDHAQSEANIGSHVGIDATKKLPAEGYKRVWPEKITMAQEFIKKVEEKFPRKLERRSS
ncbi:menaquinone biosynthesis decarboxylase [Candidatus Methylacidiphilum fumarolicum]|uniref:3-polyprenyl-4-hydroxybenzoate decarboxylase n=2 Tax=Candidatus Methylacidiphilum fumarolicum TaxID=591154 RepID=I0JYP3_METFB|nr:menaquinone biosynthesis decarboxylase [Candidatus Methylacidiphilum fumarolicum]MBW6415084.1 menaquinone biosynthesis decarboxylase [Candidatus Methylacidiphilum fumarolicum]TFE69684.1 menaquinone biosynthesis decarboxylase [Candidatus Methylacidiphilum fumarolicum]TFE74840.1 menaquinone biosynthesis decarboxylase [Candidatus Methylacidiphilum fumarolicum]TFE75485.1 menaquinone biosynthesis decarboxylase [Candidatus Methylacidiphilum fumarolicum]TFE78006.1 menaquinone biosynthesis decarbox